MINFRTLLLLPSAHPKAKHTRSYESRWLKDRTESEPGARCREQSTAHEQHIFLE